MTNQVARVFTDIAPEAGDAHPLFERHPVPSLLWSRAGMIENANAAARHLLQAGGIPLIGAAVADVFPGLSSSLLALAPPHCHPRLAVQRADGSAFYARVQVVAAGAVPAALLLVSIEDLSEYERELAAANKEFESLTAAAGHDLRGPMRILKGFAEALEDECGATLNEEGRGFLNEIIKASGRMDDLIDGLLQYSRASRAEVSRENLDLTTLIDLVFYEMRHAQAGRSVESHVDPDMNTYGDVRLMMTVLRNLIGNAWKFTSRNSAANVRCHMEHRDGHDWICVADDGAGFEMAQAERLFKPFTRLHRQDEFPGQGLGLATVHRIIQRHGGEIEATSKTGQGTVVRFWLPRAPE